MCFIVTVRKLVNVSKHYTLSPQPARSAIASPGRTLLRSVPNGSELSKHGTRSLVADDLREVNPTRWERGRRILLAAYRTKRGPAERIQDSTATQLLPNCWLASSGARKCRTFQCAQADSNSRPSDS